MDEIFEMKEIAHNLIKYIQKWLSKGLCICRRDARMGGLTPFEDISAMWANELNS